MARTIVNHTEIKSDWINILQNVPRTSSYGLMRITHQIFMMLRRKHAIRHREWNFFMMHYFSCWSEGIVCFNTDTGNCKNCLVQVERQISNVFFKSWKIENNFSLKFFPLQKRNVTLKILAKRLSENLWKNGLWSRIINASWIYKSRYQLKYYAFKQTHVCCLNIVHAAVFISF